ncbi:MAG TPA: AI-2E family transporter [Solirubrobacteraceae bacterium]|nr:AI-2E family transporter [Solirubrobacteraceae bacterium]
MPMRRTPPAAAQEAGGGTPRVRPEELSGLFAAPAWLRDLGVMSWLLVGAVAVVVGVVWLIDLTATITIPVIIGVVVGAVAGPLVGMLHRRGVPRGLGAALVMLLIVAAGVGVLLMTLGGLATQASSISSALTQALDEIDDWLQGLGIKDGTVKAELQQAVPQIGGALIGGVTTGIKELSSVVMLLTFAVFTLFFVLKDGPDMRRWVSRNMGVPQSVGLIVTGNTIRALRQYFLGVTIVALFNAVMIGGTALLIGVPLAGTIAVVTFIGAYVPFVGAWVAGAFAVGLALAGGGTSDAVVMAVMALLANGILQQIVQPIAFGATLSLNPLVVLIATIGGGCLFGMVGLILSAPLVSAAVQIVKDLGLGDGGEQAAAEQAAPA